MSWECDLVAEMSLILKKKYFWPDYSRASLKYDTPKKMSHDFVRGQSVAETCFSHQV